MKRKIEKLVLHRETLRELSRVALSGVDGGISGSRCGNDTCIQLCPTTTQTC